MNELQQPQANCPSTFRVNDSVPMVHVEDVEASALFYSLLGFECDSRYKLHDGRTNFIGMNAGQARIFLTLASGPIVPSQQAVLFYMYSPDVKKMRPFAGQALEDGGIPPGMRKRGEEGYMPERRAVYNIIHPFYMPQGELRVQDPDGYTILIGQLE